MNRSEANREIAIYSSAFFMLADYLQRTNPEVIKEAIEDGELAISSSEGPLYQSILAANAGLSDARKELSEGGQCDEEIPGPDWISGEYVLSGMLEILRHYRSRFG